MYVIFNMQLLRAAVNIHQQQIIQQQILDEIVLIKSLLIGHQQILDLECSQLTNHIHIITAALSQQDIL